MMPTDTVITPINPTLQHFTLDDLAIYTAEQAFSPTASPDFRVFYVGRDDIHGVLMHLFTRVSLSVKMNMLGYDDNDLNNVLMSLARNPSVMVQVTLDNHRPPIRARSRSSAPTSLRMQPPSPATSPSGNRPPARSAIPRRGPRRHRRLRRLD
jgi:hypothetical protein